MFARARGSEWASDEPDEKGDKGQAEDDGDEDGAGAVGEALHGGAGALGLLDHAGDLGEDGGFAEGLGAADDSAVVVERAGEDAAADFARERG